jgi:RNA polymerase sigma-70 factor (ECF subfamily)
VAALDASLAREVARARARLGASETDAADVAQVLRQRLLVGTGAVPPRIGDYNGRGELGAWLRVAAVRELLMLRRGRRREVPIDDVAALAAGGGAPELERLKQLYRAPFTEAFREAVGELSARARTLMRQRYLHGLGADEMARLYGVHRATVARWLEAARDTLFAATRARLVQRTGIDPQEFESLARQVQSQIDVSLQALLGSVDDG